MDAKTLLTKSLSEVFILNLISKLGYTWRDLPFYKDYHIRESGSTHISIKHWRKKEGVSWKIRTPCSSYILKS